MSKPETGAYTCSGARMRNTCCFGAHLTCVAQYSRNDCKEVYQEKKSLIVYRHRRVILDSVAPPPEVASRLRSQRGTHLPVALPLVATSRLIGYFRACLATKKEGWFLGLPRNFWLQM